MSEGFTLSEALTMILGGNKICIFATNMIQIKNLNLRFKNEVIYKDFSFSLKKGEKLAITGESGKGKSTLLNLLMGFIPDFKGEITVNGIVLTPENCPEIRKITAWLPQEIALKFNTVSELFFAPFNFENNRENKPKKAAISTIFKAFDLDEDLLLKKTKEISGGQKQRIVLASCLLLKKPLLLLDEPTSALDTKIKKKVTDYILNQKELSVIAVTHDAYWIEKATKTLHLG